MTRNVSRIVLIAAAIGAAGATALAQRGGGLAGFGMATDSYTANVKYDGRFVFTRVSYPDPQSPRRPHWSHDFPAGEEHFVKIMSELTSMDTHVTESSIRNLNDPEIFKFPLLYMCEPGYWTASDDDIKALRAYLQKGGFIIFDDFGDEGRYRVGGEWANLDLQMSRVFPELRWQDVDATHPIFHSFFEIPVPHDIPQYYDVGAPQFRAWFEDNDPTKRMLAFANYSTDISEFWEWSDMGFKPIAENNEAYKLGVNEFMYGLTH